MLLDPLRKHHDGGCEGELIFVDPEVGRGPDLNQASRILCYQVSVVPKVFLRLAERRERV
jgi:hypothetical protein